MGKAGALFPAFLALLALLALLAGACASSVPGTIGAALGQRSDHRLFVRGIPRGEGAERAGLVLDDEILLIDGKDVSTMSQDDVRKAVRGEAGSALVLEIRRGSDVQKIRVVRTPLTAAKEEKK